MCLFPCPCDVLCSEWLDTLAHATSARYMCCILQLPTLSENGARQLATDVGYLLNVLSALGVAPSSVLEHLLEVLEMSVDILAALLSVSADSEGCCNGLLPLTLVCKALHARFRQVWPPMHVRCASTPHPCAAPLASSGPHAAQAARVSASNIPTR